MPFGAIAQQIDATELLVVAFTLFFLGLVLYLRREDKREGYPLEDPADGHRWDGFPLAPPAKTYTLLNGGTATMPHADSPVEVEARRRHKFAGSPYVPTGEKPMLAGVGPGAFATREEEPLMMTHERRLVAPLRVDKEWSVVKGDADPRGFTVIGKDRKPAGKVVDLWVDRSAKILRYLEVELDGPEGAPRTALLPIFYADINRRRRRVRARSLLARQLEDTPSLARPDQMTAREEERINAFFASGKLYSTPDVSTGAPA